MLRLKVTKGHLTATDRAAVRYMLEHGVAAAASKRITYAMTREGQTATLKATSRERSESTGGMVDRTYTTTLEITGC